VQLLGKGGARAYLAVSGGLDLPPYLGSRSTFPGGKLGGTEVGSIAPPLLKCHQTLCYCQEVINHG